MKKKLIYFLFFLKIIIYNICFSNIINNIKSFYFLSLNLCLENYEKKKNNSKNGNISRVKIPIYYKGLCYENNINEISSLINIESERLYETMYLVISPCIEILMKNDETIIKGFKVKSDISKCYKLTLEQIIKKGIITYKWNIENCKVPEKIISSEDTILIQADKNSIRISELEKDFNKPYPKNDLEDENNSENSKFLGMLFFPTIYINVKKVEKNYQVELSKLDMNGFNVPAENRFNER